VCVCVCVCVCARARARRESLEDYLKISWGQIGNFPLILQLSPQAEPKAVS
jgi:hypothetical protein